MRKKQGFTLIELLVVISVIALLLGLLLPALNKARDLAQCAACRGNLKGYALATQMYCDDNDDKFCPREICYFASPDPLPGEEGLTHRIGMRWCNGSVCLRDHPEYAGPFYNYMKDAKAFICPAFAILAAHGSEDPWYQEDGPKLTYYRPWYNYTMNGYLSSAWSAIQQTVVHKRALVKHPAQTYAYAEESPRVDPRYHSAGLNNPSLDPGSDAMIEGWFAIVGRNAWNVVPGQADIKFYDIIAGFHHAPSGDKLAGKGNCAFLDGHVAAHSRLETFGLAWPHGK
jgi:prepilin-type N-terminal cleavage/methylation domain-containing protein/prepilin-type processing-associated H-X9-DG protein